MESELSVRVDECRRRMDDSARELERVQGIVRDLVEEDRVSPLPEAERQLKRARADLQRTRKAHAALQREYARLRLRHGIGHDPAHIDTELFDQELLRISRRPLIRADAPDLYDGRIGPDVVRAGLLAHLELAAVIENERADRKQDVLNGLLDDHASTKAILRQWAAVTQSDEYVSSSLVRGQEALERFDRALDAFSSGLDSLRITYELLERKVDSVAIAFEDGRASLVAANYWSNIESKCPDEAACMLEQFCILDTAREEIREARDDLNEELRRFMSVFVPRYLGYATRRPPPKGEERELSVLGARKVCRYLLDEIERTDFLLPGGGGMELRLPRVPANIAPFRKCTAYRQYRKAQAPRAPEPADSEGDIE
ncbi:hypothetical protein HQ560_14860 [bacterium]|nr:hypothetical protein [bacterium]